MSDNFRPEPQDGFSSLDRELHEYQEHDDQVYDGYYDEDEEFDEDEYDYYDDEDEEDGQPSEYTEWMDFDPDC